VLGGGREADNRDAKGVEGKGMGRGTPPPQPPTDLGERRN